MVVVVVVTVAEVAWWGCKSVRHLARSRSGDGQENVVVVTVVFFGVCGGGGGDGCFWWCWWWRRW